MTKLMNIKMLGGIFAMLMVATTTFGQEPDARSLRDYLMQSPEFREFYNQQNSGQVKPFDNGFVGPRMPNLERLDYGTGRSDFGLSRVRDNFDQFNTRRFDDIERYHGVGSSGSGGSGSIGSGYPMDYESRRMNSDMFDRDRDHFRSSIPAIPSRYRERLPRDIGSSFGNESERFDNRDYSRDFDRGLGGFGRPASNGLDSRERSFPSRDYPSQRPDRSFQNRDNRNGRNRFDQRDLSRRDFESNFGPRLNLPGDSYQDLPSPGSRPVRQRRSNDTTDVLTKVRTSLNRRYSNPSVQRFLRTMTPNKSMQLHQEISQMIDQRHYQPVSYETRMNRVLQHLNEAMDNDAFLNANRIDRSRASAFRSELSQYSGRVSSMTQMQSAMQNLMSSAQRQLGLNPSVIAYEFIVASIEPLDKYSAFEPADPGHLSDAELETDVKVAMNDVVVGVGVQIKQHDDGLLIDGTLKNGPAAAAGLRKGDIITGINGRRIGGMPMAASADMISGPEGSSVQLTVTRSGRSRRLNLSRRRIQILAVNETAMLDKDKGVAYLKLDKFNGSSSKEVDQALWSLHRQGMKSLVFDLRGNPGGLLDECVDICNKFVPCGTIVSTRGRLASDNTVERATYAQTWKVPIVVLVDGNSASASEIFAAAIQDNDRGIVVGEKSYGKGTVQTHFPLNSVNGKLRLTTARFFSPEGRVMAGAGVTPDVRSAGSNSGADSVLREAVVVAGSREAFNLAEASRQCRIRNRAENTDSKDESLAKAN